MTDLNTIYRGYSIQVKRPEEDHAPESRHFWYIVQELRPKTRVWRRIAWGVKHAVEALEQAKEDIDDDLKRRKAILKQAVKEIEEERI